MLPPSRDKNQENYQKFIFVDHDKYEDYNSINQLEISMGGTVAYTSCDEIRTTIIAKRWTLFP